MQQFVEERTEVNMVNTDRQFLTQWDIVCKCFYYYYYYFGFNDVINMCVEMHLSKGCTGDTRITLVFMFLSSPKICAYVA